MIDPIRRFGGLLERALRTELQEPTAMALATADARGRPSVRMVLLKDFDDGSFTFYTNLESRKALELDENPWGALCFHWPPLEVQVTIEGPVTRVPDEQADAYFASRPRGSQIGAWASLQSRPLASFSDLEERVLEIQARYEGGPVPRPPYWSGYRLVPERIEFWSGRASRLHERERYERDSDTGEWRVGLLYP
jgi:pyridoxamine 5'-phosphate oxidase